MYIDFFSSVYLSVSTGFISNRNMEEAVAEISRIKPIIGVGAKGAGMKNLFALEHRLVRSLCESTVKPEEFVLAFSDCDVNCTTELNTRVVNKLQACGVNNVTLFTSETSRQPPENRNIVFRHIAQHSSSDIFLFADCDDPVHYQLLELAQWSFSEYPDMRLMIGNYLFDELGQKKWNQPDLKPFESLYNTTNVVAASNGMMSVDPPTNRS